MSQSFQELTAALKRLFAEVKGPTPVLDAIGEIAVGSIEENFRVGGRFGSGVGGGGTEKWPASIRNMVRGGFPLVNNKLLSQSVAYAVEGREVVVTVGPHPGAAVMNFGAIIRAKNAPWLVFHPQGVDHMGRPVGPVVRKKSVKIPARPYGVLQDEDFEDMVDVVVAGIIQSVSNL